MSEPQPESDARETVLIVDDDATARLLLRELLLAEGLDVVEAADGVEGLTRFEQCRPALVLLDIDMPELDGLSVCKEMRQSAAKSELPIIVVSGREDADTIQQAYRYGVTDFVIKPVHAALLSHRIRGALSNRQPSDEDAGAPETEQGGLIEELPDQLYVLDRRGKIVEHSGGPTGGDAAAIDPDATIADLWPETVSAGMRRYVGRVLKSREPASWKFELERDDESGHFEARFLPRGPNRVVMILRDISAESQTAERIDRLASKDPVSGLPNRYSFFSNLEETLSEAKLRERPVGLVLLSLDGLDKIRKSAGRGAADAVVKAAADRLRGQVRTGDAVARVRSQQIERDVARLGNNEFVLLLENVGGREETKLAAGRVVAALAEAVLHEGCDYRVQPRYGLAVCPDDGTDVESLLAASERRIIAAGVADDAAESASASTGIRRDLLAEIRWAFAEEQFELHYLPKLDIHSGDLAGVEALLRWCHPLRGQVPLDQFLPLLEDSGLILEVGDWVLRRACAQALEWAHDPGVELRVAVNCSLHQFVRGDFVERVRRTLSEIGLPAERLELELTEGILMRDADDSLQKLHGLREAGVALALDDFGSGFTSLGTLSRLPLDTLKIDRCFVQRVLEDPEAQAVCGIVVDTAHRCGAKAVAEGVETDAQLEYLSTLGCDQMQGYLYAQPLPPADLARFLERDRPQRAHDDEDVVAPILA